MRKDVKEANGNRSAKRVGPGRPKKNQEILARMALAFEPENTHPIIFNDKFCALDQIEPLGIDAKFAGISHKLLKLLENAREKAKFAAGSEDGIGSALMGLRQWASDDLPEKVVHACEKHLYANERVISALLAHLAERVVISEEIKSIAFAARQRAEDELRAIPPVMVDFANRLIAAGISGIEVRKISKERLAAVIGAIRETSADAEIGAIPCIPDDKSLFPDKYVSSSSKSDVSDDVRNVFIGKPQNGGYPSVSPDSAAAAGNTGAKSNGDGFVPGDLGSPGTVILPPYRGQIAGDLSVQDATAPAVNPSDGEARGAAAQMDFSLVGVGVKSAGSDVSQALTGPVEQPSMTTTGPVEQPSMTPLSRLPSEVPAQFPAGSPFASEAPAQILAPSPIVADETKPLADRTVSAAQKPASMLDLLSSDRGVRDAGSGGNGVAGQEALPEKVALPVVPPGPRGMWDDLDLTPFGYRIEEAVASTDADMEALRIRLPETRLLQDLAVPRTQEHMVAEAVVNQRDRLLMDRFIRDYTARTGIRISEMEKRIWCLLLIDLKMGLGGRLAGKNGWFNGIVLPGPAGSTRVRRIWSIDQSAEALSEAYIK